MADANIPESAQGPYVYDYKTAPNRQIILPQTVPLPGFKAYAAEQEAERPRLLKPSGRSSSRISRPPSSRPKPQARKPPRLP